jgi:protoporphyrinogen/coproporphyrinogen III oxidase
VAVAGAGLNRAHHCLLSEKKRECILKFSKKKNRPGGVIQTHHENGFTFEGGPNSGILSKPEVPELLEELKNDCKPGIG